MKLKETREQLEQQLRTLALEKQKTLDSLQGIVEPKKRKRVYELLQMQNEQQETLAGKLKRVQENEQKATLRQNSRNQQNQKVKVAVELGFAIMMLLLVVAVFQYQFSFFESSPFQWSSSITGLSVGEIPTAQVQDKNNKNVGSNKIEMREDGKYNLEVHIPDEISPEVPDDISTSGTSIAQAQEVSITMDDAEILQKAVSAKADYYTRTPPVNSRLHTKVVSVEGVGKVNATIRLPKSGNANTNVNTIFRCDDFDQDKFECKGWEATDIPFDDTGTEIIFVVDHFSAYVAGEIVAINAVHLDSGYNFISNIFDDIKAVDDIWSEPIAEGEFVRVTYERNLTDGRVIDIFVRSADFDSATAGIANAYVEVYEAGTNNLVGSSNLILSPSWQYITVGGLTQPMDVFDLRITSTDPQAKVEFDYIHDNIISPTQADGMVLWGGLNNASGQYQIWGSTNNLSEVGRTEGLGVNGTADIQWAVLKSTWKRDEMMLGTQGVDRDINIQVFNNTNQVWTPLVEVTTTSSATSQIAFDLAYEDISGDALIVYDNTSTNDLFMQYVTWNGSRFSEFDNITLQDPSLSVSFGARFFTYLFPQSRTDNIMLLTHNNTNGGGNAGSSLFAVPWTGSSFNMAHALVLTNFSASQVRQEFAFAWEGTSGDGVAFYGRETSANVADIQLRRYNLTTGWGNEENVASINSDLRQLRVCADPNSDYIAAIWSDMYNRVNVTAWNGSQIMDNSPLMDGTAQAAATSTVNIACQWFNETSALFTFQDTAPLGALDYFTFSRPNTWNTSDLTETASTYVFSLDNIVGLNAFKHPTTPEIMFVAANSTLAGPRSKVSMIRWNGTQFISVAESPIAWSIENGVTPLILTENWVFEWFRYDPFPNVTTLVPALNSEFNVNDLIDVGGNVTDNLLLPQIPMYVNITYPNGSNFTYTASNTSNAPWKFNFTFSDDVAGVFTVTFLANDSRNSLNWTERTNFTVSAAAATGSKDLISADIFNLSRGTASQGGGFVVSSTTAGFINGTSLSAVFTGSTGLSAVNLSSGVININVSLLRNGSHGNYPNVTFAWVLAKSNGSTMLNTTIQNNTFNQSAFNYSFNANLLPDGIYNISVFVENISEEATRVVNYSLGFDIAIDRTPPNVTFFTLNISNAATIVIGTIIQFNASLNDSTLSVETVRLGFRNSVNGTEFNVTALKVDSIWNVTLQTSTMSASAYTVFVYGNDTLGNLNNSVGNLTFTLTSGTNTLPTAPLTFTPANDSSTTNRTPIFMWGNSTDVDGNVISYHIQVDDNARFNNPEINVSAIEDLSRGSPEGNTTWYSNIELSVDTTYYWRVRANDSTGFGTWSNGAAVDGPGDASNLSNFTVSSLLSITMFTSGVEFGSVAPGTEVNTSDGVPAPFRAENTGNIDTNVSLNASAIFTTVAINNSAYQFKIRENESNAFSTALSATGWTNMSNSTTAAHVVNLTWRDARNDFLTDINLTIPSDEPPGFKTSTITFTVVRNE